MADPLTGLAAEALAAAAGLPATRLQVLDSADPGRVGEVLAGDLDATLLVHAADAADPTAALLHDTVAAAIRAEGLDPAERTVLVATEPDTQGHPVPGAGDPGPGRPTVVLGGACAGLSGRALVSAGLAVLDASAAPAAASTGSDPTGDADPMRTGPVLVEGPVQVYAGRWWTPGANTLADALRALLATLDVGAPLVLSAHLDREGDASVSVLRAELARRTGRPTVFGFVPRRAAAPGGLCQLTADPDPDSPAPGPVDALLHRQAAQAREEAAAGTGPVLRLHLTDRVAGLVTVARAVQRL